MTKTLFLIACASAACNKSEPAPPPMLADLTQSLDAVRADLNAHASEPRFVTLLSAT